MQELCLLSEQLESLRLLLLGKVELDYIKSLSTHATQRSTFFAKGKRAFSTLILPSHRFHLSSSLLNGQMQMQGKTRFVGKELLISDI